MRNIGLTTDEMSLGRQLRAEVPIRTFLIWQVAHPRWIRTWQVDDGSVTVDDLSEAERFLIHFATVPSLDRKLGVIALMCLFTQLVGATRASIRTMRDLAAEVINSQTLATTLALTLRVGNILNRGTARGCARAFDVDVLPSLAAVKASTDTRYSLLHFIADQARPASPSSRDDMTTISSADGREPVSLCPCGRGRVPLTD